MRRHFGLSCLDLYTLAECTRRILPHSLSGSLDSLLPDRQLQSSIKRVPQTGLGRILDLVWDRLPLELSRAVFSYLSDDMTSALMRALQTPIYLESASQLRPKKEIRYLLNSVGSDDDVEWFSGCMISMFGNTYLHQVSITKSKEKNPYLAVPINSKAIRGLKFVLGTYGLRALCVVYQDGTNSLWLGDPSNGYHGIVHGQLSDFVILSDVYTICLRYFLLLD